MIGGIAVYGDAILSPMDGYSDLPFRSICRELGSAMSYTEVINAMDIVYGNPHIHEKLEYLPFERPIAFQIFDNDPDRMVQAALKLMERQPDILDVNLGCSSRGVSGRGAGAGLLKTPAKIAEIFRRLTAVLPVPVTAKMRLGWDETSRNYLDVARLLEDHGAAAIVVHGRTRRQGYTGQADWDAIAEVRQAVRVPVLANGDVRSPADIDRLKTHTGCPAVLIGRGAIGNPWIFSRMERDAVPPDQVHGVMRRHLGRMLAFYGPQHGLIWFRKHAERYLRTYQLPVGVRQRLLTTLDVDEFWALVETM